jgi:DNA-3-methyladenine glycosylase II
MTAHAVRHLKRADPVIASVIERVGPCRFETRANVTHFESIARAIVFQQLSGKAASTIWGRLAGLHPGGAVSADGLLALDAARIRAAGVSTQKLGYLRDLAARVRSGDVPLDGVEALEDDAVIASLTRVKGVGRWTAQMFLMFRLGRLDVLPEADLGIQKAVKVAYRMRAMPSAERLRKVAAPWQPYRTIACWYLWRSLENGDGQM